MVVSIIFLIGFSALLVGNGVLAIKAKKEYRYEDFQCCLYNMGVAVIGILLNILLIFS